MHDQGEPDAAQASHTVLACALESLAPHAGDPADARVQAAALAVLLQLANESDDGAALVRAEVQAVLAAPAHAQASLPLAAILAGTDSAATAQALKFLDVLCQGGGDPLVTTAELGISPSSLTLILLNSLSGSGDNAPLVAPAVALLVTLRKASPDFWSGFIQEGWNALVLRAMIRQSRFQVPACAPGSVGELGHGEAWEGKQCAACAACTLYALLVVSAPETRPWLCAFFARRQVETAALVTQLSASKGQHAPSRTLRAAANDGWEKLRSMQATLLQMLGPLSPPSGGVAS
ncbi:hypothetical protein T492DRAFT_957596 [Pavlovales sp. CCMP2436]|nr:hypothetical protein T492DRAFT_957596 [Pavlovales sp. CCMP2436]